MQPIGFRWNNSNCHIIAALHGVLSLNVIKDEMRKLYYQSDKENLSEMIKKLVYLQYDISESHRPHRKLPAPRGQGPGRPAGAHRAQT